MLVDDELRKRMYAQLAAKQGLLPEGAEGPEYRPDELAKSVEGPEYKPELLNPAPEQQKPDELAQANAQVANARRVGGLGRAGMMLAKAFGAQNADTSTFDSMITNAQQRRDMVRKYMQDKLAAEQGQKWDLEKLAKTQEGQVGLATLNNAAEMDRTKYVQGEEYRRLLAQLGAQKEKAKAEGDEKRLKAIQDAEDGLRKELMGNQVTKDTQQVAAAYSGIKSALGRNTPAGHMAGVFLFMKALDPSSSVREGEYANARNAAGVPDQIRNMYNQALSGKLLGDSQVKDFIDTVGAKFKSQLGEYERIKSAYVSAAPAGANPRNIAPLEFNNSQPAAPSGPTRTDPKDRKSVV